MNTSIRSIVAFFCENAKTNAMALGVNQSVKFTLQGVLIDGGKGENIQAEKSFFDFSEISYRFSLGGILRMLKSLSGMPAGTTVVFTHCRNEQEVEYALSACGFRVYEHFSITRVAKKIFGEESEREISYCLAVKK